MRNVPAQQEWVIRLPIMQQSVLFAAIRAPDGIRKDHPVKVLMRWYRRCVLLSAFDGRALLDPFEGGGGSFTGPFDAHHAIATMDADTAFNSLLQQQLVGSLEGCFNETRRIYLRHVDELPHHFQLHFMHAAQIVGYKHSVQSIARWWRTFYEMIVNDAHLYPESEEQMDERLSDGEDAWRAREEVTAL
jgi:hypothetical protein